MPITNEPKVLPIEPKVLPNEPKVLPNEPKVLPFPDFTPYVSRARNINLNIKANGFHFVAAIANNEGHRRTTVRSKQRQSEKDTQASPKTPLFRSIN